MTDFTEPVTEDCTIKLFNYLYGVKREYFSIRLDSDFNRNIRSLMLRGGLGIVASQVERDAYERRIR
jgi:hypothetical protein